MTEEEKYLFDLKGFLVLRDVVDADTIARANSAIDSHFDQIETHERQFEGGSQALASEVRQKWCDEMVTWGKPHGEPFRELMVQPLIKPYLAELLGSGYRIARQPRLIIMDRGCAGHYMHGGQVDRQGFEYTYRAKFGHIYCSHLLVEFPLADEGPGQGGLALIPGGHKANYPIPQSLRDYEAYQDEIVEVEVKAGDAVIFAEITIHGTMVWNGEHQRRTLLYGYNPGYQGGEEPLLKASYPEYVQDMTEEQRTMLRPPV
jgi:hypothetical protein